MERALHALHRSIGAVLADQLGPSSSRPPPEWGPVAVFAALCATAHKEPRPAGGARGAAPQFGASSMFGGADMSADSVMRAASTIYEGDEEADPAEGWDIIARPGAGWGVGTLAGGGAPWVGGRALLLPPLPSQPDAVEQWTRAMFTDNVPKSGTPRATGGGLPLMGRLQQLDSFARHLSVAQLSTLRDRLLAP